MAADLDALELEASAQAAPDEERERERRASYVFQDHNPYLENTGMDAKSGLVNDARPSHRSAYQVRVAL
jgi:hypothetical protein